MQHLLLPFHAFLCCYTVFRNTVIQQVFILKQNYWWWEMDMKCFHPPGCYQVFYRLAILTKHAPAKFALIELCFDFQFSFYSFWRGSSTPRLENRPWLMRCSFGNGIQKVYKYELRQKYGTSSKDQAKLLWRHLRPETFQWCVLWVTYSSYLFCQRSNAYQKALWTKSLTWYYSYRVSFEKYAIDFNDKIFECGSTFKNLPAHQSQL